MVRSCLDLPGALVRVGLPSPPSKGGGGLIRFGGGPLLATTLSSAVSFMPLEGSAFAGPQPAVLSPHSVSLRQFLLLNPFIHFTFLEVCRANR